MTLHPISRACILLLVAALPAGAFAARATSDLLPPQRRQATVDKAQRLAEPNTPPPLPEDLPSPFNPVDFDKPDPADMPVAAAAPGALPPPPPPTDSEIVEILAAQLTPTGAIEWEGRPLLVMGSRRFQVGTRFIVTYNNQDYELELVSIDRTNFTIRYRGEEFTRPIKSVR